MTTSDHIQDLKQITLLPSWRISEALNQYIEKLEKEQGKKGTRSLAQNNALWLYLSMLSQELNDAGLDMKQVVKVDIEWNKDNAMEYLWRPIQKSLFQETSTRKLNKSQVSEVYEHLNRLTAQKWGISIPFPSDDNKLDSYTLEAQNLAVEYPTEEAQSRSISSTSTNPEYSRILKTRASL